MDNQEKYTEDLLRNYIDPEKTEKAPEGFTSQVMSRIHMQELPVTEKSKSRSMSFIPYISAGVVILLLAAAILIPGSKSDSLAGPVAEFLKNLKSSIPKADIISVSGINFPMTLVYVFTGIFILSLFDRALYGMFNREK
jgi:hypothetical protein